jgi:acyl-CoA thioester hydrolase
LARIDRAALERAHLPETFVLPIRFDDLDFQGHVNNAAVPVFLQEARVAFNKIMQLGELLGVLRPMVAGISIEYAAELTHPGSVEIHTGVTRIGRSSFTLHQIARQNGRSAIYAETTLVIADANGPAELPAAFRRNLESIQTPILSTQG